jgi:hypothetical protein
MQHHFVCRPAFVLLITMTATACWGTSAAQADDLREGAGLKWYRGNLHTHSHWSDGNDYLEMIALWYRDHGYQFLVFTDHNVLADTERWINVEKSKGGRAAYEELKATFPDLVEERKDDAGQIEVRLRTFREVADELNQPGEFLLIQGEEISDSFENRPIHLNASNVLELIPPLGGGSVFETIQNNVRAVMAQRERTGQPMIVHLNHPNFGYAVTAEDIMLLRGDRFFEVYNGHPTVHNSGDEIHAGTERVWDIILTRRLAELDLPVMFGLAVDDGHNYHNLPTRGSDPGRGWVNVLSKELTAAALIEALEAGRFYSSSGVALRRIHTSEEQIAVEVEPADGETYVIDFIGTRQDYDPTSHPVTDASGKEIRATRRYSSDIGQTLATVRGTQATYCFTGDEIYVRARITSSAEHPNPSELGEHKRAWCQPVIGPGSNARQE